MSFKESLFGNVPDDWNICEIGEIAELRQGLQISKKLRFTTKVDGSVPLLKITDLPSRVFSEFVKNIPANYVAKKDDIIYTRTGQVGLVYTDITGCVHNNCFKVIVDYNKFDKYFMYYYLKSTPVRNFSNAVASGSVQRDLTHTAFKKCLIAYPSLEKQKAIAYILLKIDDKIEINNQINKNLQSISQLLFKHWFVDFEFPNEEGNPYRSSGGKMVESELGMIPKGWEIKTIKDITYNFDSKRKPLSSRQRERKKGIYPYYGATSIIDYIDEYIFDGIYVLLGEDGTVINSEGTPVLQYIWRKAWVNNHAHVLQGNGISSELLYLYLSSLNVSNIVTGAVQLKINQTNLNSVKVVYAKKQIIEQFDSLIQTIFATLRTLKDENECLSNLRDTLLPKLMNGEIDVSNIEMNN